METQAAPVGLDVGTISENAPSPRIIVEFLCTLLELTTKLAIPILGTVTGKALNTSALSVLPPPSLTSSDLLPAVSMTVAVQVPKSLAVHPFCPLMLEPVAYDWKSSSIGIALDPKSWLSKGRSGCVKIS
nr:hypothetical protein [Candidatus Sigynarchaeota archaeon]